MRTNDLREVGIEALAVRVPRCFLELAELARANDVDPDKYRVGLGCRRMAVPSADEDPVVLAADAARDALRRSDVDPATIGLVVVGTESGVDAAKPIAAYVHRLAGLPSDCRAFDVQHACYGGTAALRTALDWLESRRPGRRALVVATDIARYDVGSAGEPTQGGGATALILGDRPRLVRFERHADAVHTEEVMDFWRPPARSTALTDGRYSVECYLRAARSCWRRFRRDAPTTFADFDFLLFHSPFPRMAQKAHRALFDLAREAGELPPDADADADFERRVKPTLWANAELGNAYTASLFFSLAGLLEDDGCTPGARIGLFSYGSGSCAEFISARLGDDPGAWRGTTGLRDELARRRGIDHRTYLRLREAYEEASRDGSFRTPPAEQGIAFCGTWNQQRIYRDAAGNAAPDGTRRTAPTEPDAATEDDRPPAGD
jgi:hydroxymethylglutaryl-CoA synthase